MNRTKIKNYGLQAVKDRAAFFGLTADRIDPVTVKGNVALIAGRAFPRAVADKRKALQERVERDGFGPAMEALAYTWFNRLVAIRYMELHGYLEHGYRVLSPSPHRGEGARTAGEGGLPEILEHAEHVELPDLNREHVIELKLDGTKEAELYRTLLVAQCNALHAAMPFLFERIGDETELVLPDSLLHSDSIVRKLVSGIDEEDWQEVEVIGWLYEAYISERYEEVIGKVVASADIPAATQRFTPKWIVRYLVQNTLGRLWLATYPQSPLKGQMKYYIEPAEQTPEVQEQLRAITPTSLNPEEITFLDPACGSAHILVEAYDVFKAIYQKRGYRAKDIPRLILSKNLFGLEIDDRAAQLAAFALMMKARADDRRVFEQGIQLHVRTLVQTDGMDAEDIAAALNVNASKEMPPPGQLFETEDSLFTCAAAAVKASQSLATSDVNALIDVFGNAKTFGSLIQVPSGLIGRLAIIEETCCTVAAQAREIASRTAAKFLSVVEQASMLANHIRWLLGLLSSKQTTLFLTFLNPTIEFQTGDIGNLPTLSRDCAAIRPVVEAGVGECIDTARVDWDSFETSWNFKRLHISQVGDPTLQQADEAIHANCMERFQRMKMLEETNNRLFIEAYGLQDELSPDVPDDQITLYRPNREEDIKRLISYAVGCTMGRYSLDKPGLIYAHGDNVGFDPGQYIAFPADPDGIVPVMEADWFADDAANRFVEFVGVVWPGNSTTDHTDRTDNKENIKSPYDLSVSSVSSVVKSATLLEENLKFVADSLGPSRSEQPRETIRRYLATGFFKHHLQTYKRRPIYWLFSSGKLRAFQCLVYLHRYHEGTLARMRTEYVIPLQGKLASRIDLLAGDIAKATSTSHRNSLTKERDKLIKQQAELQTYDEKLRHFAEMRISLDLDDGVKVNYGKFGDLLAEVKAVTGGKDEE